MQDLKTLEKIAAGHIGEKGGVIAILQEVQDALGYIPEEAVNWIADRLWIPRSAFFGVATFYAQFYFTPRGKNIITACCGTACHVKGSERLINGIARELNLAGGQDTTPDMEFTLEKVNCVGACSIAPVVIINKKVHGKAGADKIRKELKALRKTDKNAAAVEETDEE
ncbi:MAG: NAD(P)H-dependent oxidoreductase subunit E [Thermodesulfovibrionales bacterium]|nr:NAD(P)H-dependent oxidoreductase subunit E [Thermodesulfovibrionales bacterium]